jgi:hypothetical protein
LLNYVEYPEQKHAGAVGLGPEYGKGLPVDEKLKGLKEEVEGKIIHNPELAEKGKERRTGELKKKKEREDDSHNPFNTARSDGEEE